MVEVCEEGGEGTGEGRVVVEGDDVWGFGFGGLR